MKTKNIKNSNRKVIFVLTYVNLKKFATAKPSYASDKISMSVREYGEIDEQTSAD